MIILPTVNAFCRHEKLGSLQLAQGAARERNVRVRMLMPRNGYDHQSSEKQMSHQLRKQYLDIRYIESTVTLLVADRKSSLVIELKDDLKDTFNEAAGRSTYSNNIIVVLFYIAIFENLWNQSELYQQIFGYTYHSFYVLVI